MGNKPPWFKLDSNDLLADVKVRELSWVGVGVYMTLLAVLHSQTDECGKLIINGHSLCESELLSTLKAYRNGGQGVSSGTRNAVETILKTGLIRVSKNGYFYSPRMVKDFEKSEHARIGASARWSKTQCDSQCESPPNALPRIRERKDIDNTLSTLDHLGESKKPRSAGRILRQLLGKEDKENGL